MSRFSLRGSVLSCCGIAGARRAKWRLVDRRSPVPPRHGEGAQVNFLDRWSKVFLSNEETLLSNEADAEPTPGITFALPTGDFLGSKGK